MFRKAYIIMRDFVLQMRKQNISAFAASTAFFFFLSMVPMLMLVCTIIPFTPLTEENLVTVVGDLIPERVAPLAISLIAEVYEKSAGILSIAAVATLWSAGKGVLALMRGLNGVNGVEEKRNYLVVRMVASFYTLVMLVVMVLSLYIMVFGNHLVNILFHRIPQLRMLADLFMKLRFLLIWVVLALLFSAMYAYVPDKKLRFLEQLPGGIFSAVMWSFFSWAFSLYIGTTESYGIYGSLSIIIIIMLWMYFCMYIMLIGAYINRYFRPLNKVFFRRRSCSKGKNKRLDKC